MSSRVRSDLGSIGQRAVASGGGRSSSLPCHVWVREDAGWVPGLLVGWTRTEDGSWWGRVALSDDEDGAQLVSRAAVLLRRVEAVPPLH